MENRVVNNKNHSIKKNPFYNKLKSVFATKEFKEFSKEFLNEELEETSSIFFIYFFSVYVKGKKIMKDEPKLDDVIDFVDFLVHDPNYRKTMIESFKNNYKQLDNSFKIKN